MDNAEFKALLIENINYLDKTCKRLQELDKEIFDCFSRCVKDWADENGWAANSDYWQDDELWIAKEEWRTSGSDTDENEFDLWFSLEVAANDKENFAEPFDYLYSTRLCRAGHGSMGFRLNQSQLVKGREFKRICETIAHEFATTPFILDENRSIFLPIFIDRTKLSEAFRNENLEVAISEIGVTLDEIKKADAQLKNLVSLLKSAKGM